MRSILVPTDFSACAGYATDTAMQLANKFGANVHLYSCLDLPYNWHTLSEEEKEANPEAIQKVKNADILFKDIKSKYPNIDIYSISSAGSLVMNISDYVKKYGIDFIVMGSHGVSGKNEFFIGSNTQKVVRSVHCPVLIVKNKIEKIDFKKVVFASSFLKNEKEAFLKFKDIVKHFIPEIHLVAIQTSGFLDPPYIVQMEAMKDFKELAKPFKCEIHISRDFSVNGGIRYFADKLGANLIGVSNRHRHPLKRMFVGSNVETLVNHADLPVLTIDYNDAE